MTTLFSVSFYFLFHTPWATSLTKAIVESFTLTILPLAKCYLSLFTGIYFFYFFSRRVWRARDAKKRKQPTTTSPPPRLYKQSINPPPPRFSFPYARSTVKIRELKQRHLWLTHVKQKWGLFSYDKLWRQLICIGKSLYSYRDDFAKNLAKTATQEFLKKVHFRLTCVAQKCICGPLEKLLWKVGKEQESQKKIFVQGKILWKNFMHAE